VLRAVRIVRTANVLVSFAGTVVGALAAVSLFAPWPAWTMARVGLAAGSAALVTAAGNVLNDLEDREGDRLNHPDRPLVTGEITVRGARRLTVGLFLAGIVFAVPVALSEPAVGAILGIAVAGLLLYELRFKARGLVGNVTVGGLTAMVFLYGGASVGALLAVVPFAAMAFLATLSREVIKDMEDVAGDLERTTLPKRLGLPASGRVAQGFVLGAIALSAVPFLTLVVWSSPAGLAYLALVLVADATFVLSVAHLPSRLHFEQTVSKGAMAIALGAFLAVAFR
jgi:geranylgeranylglycerol-phosphate geranylgeranyltransferase